MDRADRIAIAVTVDGKVIAGDVVARETLAEFLRLRAQATSVHVGCNQGICGACTVLLDGSPVRSCLIFAVQADQASVVTVASVATFANESTDEKGLTALQRAFQRHHALQCGFCTPGLLVATTLFLAENFTPDHDAILDHLNGHLCRCTGYATIIAAIEAVIAERRAR